MQSYLLGLVPSSSDGGGGFLLSSWKPAFSLGAWVARFDGARRWRTAADRLGPIAASIRGEQDHYAVLGLSRVASAAEVKKAYRLLARKYHPDVSKDLQAGEMFKSVRLAYEVLSNESTRCHYDRELKFQEAAGRSHWRQWTYDPEVDDRRRIYRWAELRHQMRYEYERRKKEKSYGRQRGVYEENIDYQREPFAEVLWFAFLRLLLMQVIGIRLTLTLTALTSVLDNQLDAGYKMGYVVACFLGGRGGILLTLCILFASWLCGKNSSGFVALLVLAMWVGVNLSRFAPIPQGAVLAMVYMSIKLQVNYK